MPRQARTKVRVFFVLLLLLLVVGSVSYLGWRQSVAGPSVVTPPPRLVSPDPRRLRDGVTLEHDVFVPALRFGWLTRFYDPLLRTALREEKFKGLLTKQAAVARPEA